MRRIIPITVFISLLIAISSFISGTNTSQLNWLKIDEVDQKIVQNGKPVLIDLYTDWCGWCKHMDKNTFNNPEVAKYLKENFYVVKFNAEQEQPLTFRGRTYARVPNTKYNELAVAMLNGKMAFPTIVYLDEEGKYHSTDPGYKTPEQLLTKLKQLAEQ